MWKQNWEDTKQHFVDWWNREGLVIGGWGGNCSQNAPHEQTAAPPEPASVRESYEDAEARALRNHHGLAHASFPADILPIANTDIGPGSLALYLGSNPGFAKTTVWFEPTMKECTNPEELPPLSLDGSNHWFQVTMETAKACADLGRGKYLVGCPDLIENIDIIAALRDPQTLLMDMIERPEWVELKVQEINKAWFDVYERIYDVIKLEDGSSAFGAFRVWGPGKTAKLQCDASAMFSPEMFDRFVLPCLSEQCSWLDYSIYHLDGTDAMCHLDSLLAIEDLDAIEWTPESGIEGGGHPRWYDLYRKILDAGKSVQALGVGRNSVIPLLDAVGGKGMYLLTGFDNHTEAEEMMAKVEQYR